MTLTVVILTFNEAKHIEACIQSAQQVTQDVLVIDSGSTDGTVALAEAAGARVLFRAWSQDFAAQRNFSIDKSDASWLLYLDADERISPELAANIQNAITRAPNCLYSFRRQNIVFGQTFRYGAFRPDAVIRLMPRLSGQWEGAVHERFVSSLPVQALKGFLIHYPYDNWDQYYSKFEQYTSIWAENAQKRGKHTSMTGAYCRAAFSFIKVALFNLGLLDGAMGLRMCQWHYRYTLTKYAKLHDRQKAPPPT